MPLDINEILARLNVAGATTIGGTAFANYLAVLNSSGQLDPSLFTSTTTYSSGTSLPGTAGTAGSIFEVTAGANANNAYVSNGSAWILISQTAGASSSYSTLASEVASALQPGTSATLTGVPTFNPNIAGTPFIIGSNAIGQPVAGLAAQYLYNGSQLYSVGGAGGSKDLTNVTNLTGYIPNSLFYAGTGAYTTYSINILGNAVTAGIANTCYGLDVARVNSGVSGTSILATNLLNGTYPNASIGGSAATATTATNLLNGSTPEPASFFLNPAHFTGGFLPSSVFNASSHGSLTGGTLHAVAVPSTLGVGGTAGFFSATDKEKLNGIAAGAIANPYAFNQVTVNTAGSVTSSSASTNLTLIEGSGITITPSTSGAPTLTFAASLIGLDHHSLSDMTAYDDHSQYLTVGGAGFTTPKSISLQHTFTSMLAGGPFLVNAGSSTVTNLSANYVQGYTAAQLRDFAATTTPSTGVYPAWFLTEVGSLITTALADFSPSTISASSIATHSLGISGLASSSYSLIGVDTNGAVVRIAPPINSGAGITADQLGSGSTNKFLTPANLATLLAIGSYTNGGACFTQTSGVAGIGIDPTQVLVYTSAGSNTITNSNLILNASQINSTSGIFGTGGATSSYNFSGVPSSNQLATVAYVGTQINTITAANYNLPVRPLTGVGNNSLASLLTNQLQDIQLGEVAYDGTNYYVVNSIKEGSTSTYNTGDGSLIELSNNLSNFNSTDPTATGSLTGLPNSLVTTGGVSTVQYGNLLKLSNLVESQATGQVFLPSFRLEERPAYTTGYTAVNTTLGNNWSNYTYPNWNKYGKKSIQCRGRAGNNYLVLLKVDGFVSKNHQWNLHYFTWNGTTNTPVTVSLNSLDTVEHNIAIGGTTWAATSSFVKIDNARYVILVAGQSPISLEYMLGGGESTIPYSGVNFPGLAPYTADGTKYSFNGGFINLTTLAVWSTTENQPYSPYIPDYLALLSEGEAISGGISSWAANLSQDNRLYDGEPIYDNQSIISTYTETISNGFTSYVPSTTGAVAYSKNSDRSSLALTNKQYGINGYLRGPTVLNSGPYITAPISANAPTLGVMSLTIPELDTRLFGTIETSTSGGNITFNFLGHSVTIPSTTTLTGLGAAILADGFTLGTGTTIALSYGGNDQFSLNLGLSGADISPSQVQTYYNTTSSTTGVNATQLTADFCSYLRIGFGYSNNTSNANPGLGISLPVASGLKVNSALATMANLALTPTIYSGTVGSYCVDGEIYNYTLSTTGTIDTFNTLKTGGTEVLDGDNYVSGTMPLDAQGYDLEYNQDGNAITLSRLSGFTDAQSLVAPRVYDINGNLMESLGLSKDSHGNANLASQAIHRIVWTENGLWLGGDFRSYDGTTSSGLAKINLDGTYDSLFNPIMGFNSPIWAISPVTSDSTGDVVVAPLDGGSYNGWAKKSVFRISPNGQENLSAMAIYDYPISQDSQDKVLGVVPITNGDLLVCTPRNIIVYSVSAGAYTKVASYPATKALTGMTLFYEDTYNAYIIVTSNAFSAQGAFEGITLGGTLVNNPGGIKLLDYNKTGKTLVSDPVWTGLAGSGGMASCAYPVIGGITYDENENPVYTYAYVIAGNCAPYWNTGNTVYTSFDPANPGAGGTDWSWDCPNDGNLLLQSGHLASSPWLATQTTSISGGTITSSTSTVTAGQTDANCNSVNPEWQSFTSIATQLSGGSNDYVTQSYNLPSTFNPFQDGTITYSVNGSGVQFELTVVVELNTAAPAGTTYSGSYNSSYYSLIGLQINGSLTASILLNNRSAGGLGIGGTNYRYYADAPAGWTCSVQDEIVGGVAVRSYVHIYGTDYVSGGHAITAIICPAYTSTLVGGTAQGGLNGTINVVATDLRFNGFWAAKTWATYNNFLSLYKPTTTTIQLPAPGNNSKRLVGLYKIGLDNTSGTSNVNGGQVYPTYGTSPNQLLAGGIVPTSTQNFDVNFTFADQTGINQAHVIPFAVDSNNNIYVGGPVSAINGTTVTPWRLYKLDQFGNYDTTDTFNANANFNDVVTSCIVDPSDNVIVGGRFTAYNKRTVPGIVFLDVNGLVKDNIDPNSSDILFQQTAPIISPATVDKLWVRYDNTNNNSPIISIVSPNINSWVNINSLEDQLNAPIITANAPINPSAITFTLSATEGLSLSTSDSLLTNGLNSVLIRYSYTAPTVTETGVSWTSPVILPNATNLNGVATGTITPQLASGSSETFTIYAQVIPTSAMVAGADKQLPSAITSFSYSSTPPMNTPAITSSGSGASYSVGAQLTSYGTAGTNQVLYYIVDATTGSLPPISGTPSTGLILAPDATHGPADYTTAINAGWRATTLTGTPLTGSITTLTYSATVYAVAYYTTGSNNANLITPSPMVSQAFTVSVSELTPTFTKNIVNTVNGTTGLPTGSASNNVTISYGGSSYGIVYGINGNGTIGSAPLVSNIGNNVVQLANNSSATVSIANAITANQFVSGVPTIPTPSNPFSIFTGSSPYITGLTANTAYSVIVADPGASTSVVPMTISFRSDSSGNLTSSNTSFTITHGCNYSQVPTFITIGTQNIGLSSSIVLQNNMLTISAAVVTQDTSTGLYVDQGAIHYSYYQLCPSMYPSTVGGGVIQQGIVEAGSAGTYPIYFTPASSTSTSLALHYSFSPDSGSGAAQLGTTTLTYGSGRVTSTNVNLNGEFYSAAPAYINFTALSFVVDTSSTLFPSLEYFTYLSITSALDPVNMVWGPAGSSISLGGDTNLGIQYATITLANSADTIQYAFSSTGSQSGSAWITGNAANWVTGSGTTLTLDLSYANTNLTEAIWDNAATPDTIYLFVKESNGGAIASQPLSRVPVSSLALLDYSPNDVTAFTPVTLVQSYNLVTYSLPAIGTLFQVTDVISTNQLVSGTGISVAAVWAPYSTTSSYSTNTLDITNKPNWGTGNSYGWINVSGMTGTPGFTPNLNSVSNGAIQVGIRLFSAISNHLLPSAIINYTIAFQYAPPVITSSIGGSLHSDGNLEVTVTISTPTNSYVFYTLDGSTPYEGSLKYSGPFLLRSPATITPILIAYDNGSYWNSGNPLTLSTQHTALGEATSVTLAEIGNSDMQLGMINIYFGQPIDSSAQASIATGGMMTLAVSGTSPNAPVGSIKLNAGIPGGFPGGTGLSPYWNVVDTLGGYRNANKTPLRDIFGSGNSNNSITVSPYYNTFTSTGMPGIYYNTSGVSIPTIASALSSPASTSTLAEVSNLPSANYLLIATIISGVGVTKPNNVTLNLDALTGATCLTNLQDPTCPSFINIGAPANLYGVLPASVTPDSAWTVTAMITPDNSGEPISFSLLGNNIVTLQIIKVVEFLQPALNQAVTTGTGTSAVTTYSMAGTLQVPTSTGGNYCLMYLHGSIYSTAYPNSFINDGYELLYTNDNTNYQIDINTGGENDTSPIINNRTTSYAGNITYFYGNQYFFEADPSSLIQLGWVPPSDLRVGQILNTLTVAPPASGFTTTLPYGVSYLSQNLGSNYTSLSVAAPYSGCLIPPVFALISMDAVLNTGIYARYNLYPPVIVPTKRNASTYSPTATIFSYNSEGPALCVTTNSSTPLVQPATPAIGNTVGGGTISIGTTPTIIKAAMISTATGYYYDIPAMEFTNEFTNNDVYVVTTGSDESLYVNYTLVAAPDTTAAFTYNTGDVVTLKSSSTSVTTTIKQLIGDLIPAGQAYPASKSYTQELTSYPSVTTTLVTGFSNNASVSSFTVSSETVAAAIWAGGTSYVFVTGMGIPAGVHVTSISGTTIHVGVLTNADNPFTATAASTGSYVFSTAYMAHLSQYESLSCNALVLNPGTEYATGIENRTLTPGFGTQVFTFSVPTNAPITITTTNGDTSVQSSIWVSQVPTFDYLHWNTGPVSPSLYIGCNGSLNSYDFCNPPGTGNAPDAAPVQSGGTGSYLNVYYYLSAAGQTITMLNGIEGIQSQNPMYFFCTDVAPGANAISGTNGALLAGAIYGAGEYDIGSQDEVYGQPCTAQYQITGLVTGANYYISVAENETLYYYYYSATDSSSWPTGTSGTTNILLGVSGLPAGAVFILQSNTVNAPIHSFIYEITDSGKLDKGISYKGISPTSISLPTTYTDADSTSVSPVTSIQYT